MDNGEHSMNTDLDMLEIKPDEEAEMASVCKNSLRVYGSDYYTAGDAEDVFLCMLS